MNALFDFARLASFAEDDRTLEQELCGMFLVTADRYLDDMHRAIGCAEAWAAEAHRLKGAAANIGADALAELALAAEQDQPDPGRLAQLQDALAETRQLLEKHLGRS